MSQIHLKVVELKNKKQKPLTNKAIAIARRVELLPEDKQEIVCDLIEQIISEELKRGAEKNLISS